MLGIINTSAAAQEGKIVMIRTDMELTINTVKVMMTNEFHKRDKMQYLKGERD